MKKQSIRNLLALALGLAVATLSPFGSQSAQAATITVNNFSFETGTGNFAAGAPTSWTLGTGSSTALGTQTFANGANDIGTGEGGRDLYLNTLGTSAAPTLYQDTGLLASNTEYTLTVAVATPGAGKFGANSNISFSISLLNGTDASGTLLSSNSITLSSPGSGNAAFQDLTLIFTTGATVSGDLTILLTNTTTPVSGQNYQANFDNVRLTATAVPEPGSYAMALGGFGMLIAFQRMRRRKA